MGTGVDARHNLHAALNNGQRSSNGSLVVHLRYLQIGDRCNIAPFLNDIAKKLVENRAGLLIGQERDVVLDRATRNVHVTELTWPERAVIALDTQTPRLETGG